MTGGFNVNIRGIEIDITRTLNKFLNQNKKLYTRKEFEDYLKQIGLDKNYRTNSGQQEPILEGFVVSFEIDDNNENEEAYGILATGEWNYQYWVSRNWSKRDSEQQYEFNNPKYLDENIETNLRNIWKDKLILTEEYSIRSIVCEWPHYFYR